MHRTIRIKSKTENLRIVEKAIDEISAEAGIKADCYGKLMVATMEAVNNAILHGNKSDETKEVEIDILIKGDKLVISVEDAGRGFKPSDVPDPTSPENIENITGRGVFLMSKLADNIEFNEMGNKVTMSFKEIKT
jgi:serine/threonine-protein kinase RsbW